MTESHTGIKLSLIILISLCSIQSSAQLKPGDIMFVGYNADSNDGFSVVALVDIPPSTTIYFTDNEWNGEGIGEGGEFKDDNEWELEWKTDAVIISAGIVITFNETSLESNDGYGVTRGSITGNIKLTELDEVLYTFQGTGNLTPTTFISAIASDGFTDLNGTLTKTELVVGINAISISGDKDVMVYVGDTECDLLSAADCALLIANPSNWATEDGEFDQSADGNFPDFPADLPISFGVTPLPIELMSFEARPRGEYIQLIWKTASERDNDFFTLERSKDGFGWQKLIKIAGAGNSSSVLEYTATDQNPLIGISYYRLKQTDYDGQFSYSNIESAKYNPSITKHINVYPNPTYNQITIEGAAMEHLKIYNVLYQDISNSVKATQVSEQLSTMDLSSLTQGVYIIQTKSDFIKIYKR